MELEFSGDDLQLMEPLIKAYLSQMDSALKISDILAQHENSEEITTDHLIGGLVYRLMVPMTNDEMESSLNSAEDILHNLDETDSDEEDTLNYDHIIDTYPNPSNPEFRRLKRPICNCDICSKSRVCLLNYKQHVCNDSLSQKFKDSIDSTLEKYGIFI